jgi:hypothetical protein
MCVNFPKWSRHDGSDVRSERQIAKVPNCTGMECFSVSEDTTVFRFRGNNSVT